MSGQWTTRSKSLKKGNVRASSAFSAKGHGSSAAGGGGGDEDGKGGAGVIPGESGKTFLPFLLLFRKPARCLSSRSSRSPLLLLALTPPGSSLTSLSLETQRRQAPGTGPPPAAGSSRGRSSCPTRRPIWSGSWSRCWARCGPGASRRTSSRSPRCRGSVSFFLGGGVFRFGSRTVRFFHFSSLSFSFFSFSKPLPLPPLLQLPGRQQKNSTQSPSTTPRQ